MEGVWSTLPDGQEECTWPEPRWWGVWVSWDANGESGPGWCLCGTEPPTGNWDYGVCAAQFQSDTWTGAKAVFECVMDWAHSAREEWE